MDGQINGWLDKWMVREMDGQRNGQLDKLMFR